MLNKYKSYLASKAYILLTTLALGSVVGIGYAVITLDKDNHLATVRRDLEQDLFTATDQIQLRFFEAVLVAKHIENLLVASTEVNEAQISRFVADLQLHNPGVRAVALAPGLVVTHSFPITGNQKTIGLKYWQVPEQMASVAKAYRRQSPIVDGPVPLVQGGAGYILRYPVFLPNPLTNAESFWGVISIVISADGLLSAQRQDFGDTEKYSFSLREIQASPPRPNGVQDDAGPLNARPVTTEFKMLDSTWQATVRPMDGRPILRRAPICWLSCLFWALFWSACCTSSGISRRKRKTRVRFWPSPLAASTKASSLLTITSG